jgi:hypothetical protein
MFFLRAGGTLVKFTVSHGIWIWQTKASSSSVIVEGRTKGEFTIMEILLGEKFSEKSNRVSLLII